MRVVVNTLATLRPKTGVGHYAAHLVEAMSRQLKPHCLSCFPGPALSGWLNRSNANSRRPTPRAGVFRPWIAGAAKSLGRSALGALFQYQCGPDRFNLYHEPNFLPLPSRLPTVLTVHDLSVLLHPEWHPADRVKRHEVQFRTAVADAAHVITVSETVRADVIAHLNVKPDQVTAIHNGISSRFFDVSPEMIAASRQQFELTGDYLLYCGTIEPRKNLETLLRAYCELPESVRNRCPLILAGGWGWKSESVAELYDSTARHNGVRAIGYVDDSIRPGLFAGARALVFPSWNEGFGLPPVEMLAAGRPVLASDIVVHREVLGRFAHFIDPLDGGAWSRSLANIITDDDWVKELRNGGSEHARKFEWDRAAGETIGVYQRILGVRVAA
jgi:alpha-1,3-rhamnosyl/mannosyltransferase